jgi:hypothetical protein
MTKTIYQHTYKSKIVEYDPTKSFFKNCEIFNNNVTGTIASVLTTHLNSMFLDHGSGEYTYKVSIAFKKN